MRIYLSEELYWQQPVENGGRLLGSRRGDDVYYVIASGGVNGVLPKGVEDVGVVSVGEPRGRGSSDKLHFHFNGHLKHLELDDDPVVGLEDTAQIVLYNPRTIAHLVDSPCSDSEFNAELLRLAEIVHLGSSSSCNWRNLTARILDNATAVITHVLNFLTFIMLPLNWAFKGTAVAQHFREWRTIFHSGTGRRRLLPIAIDVILGLAIMAFISRNTNPAEHLLTVTHKIIIYLRQLLESLRGSPVGLKVNVQLNDFLLNCFIYHIDLWKTFLNIVSPAISYLFAVLSVFGLCGFSFQLAMLSDLLVLITIHAHCFYIYAAVLYRLEIVGLKALWRIVLGRRCNILKKRVEAFEYQHSQLFLATLFFSSLLFLLPTVVVYYVVFSTVRLGIYSIIYTLLIIRRTILQLPVYDAVRYLAGFHLSPDSVIVEMVERGAESNPKVTVMRIKPQRAAIQWTRDLKGSFKDDYPSIGQFIGDLFKGELKGFIRPKLDE